MKKTLLLAGVACLFSVNANAMDLSHQYRPYIGLDYVYSNAGYEDLVYEPDSDYNSGAVNVGMTLGSLMSVEAFFQQSGEIKAHGGTPNQVKTEFYAYGLDLYGYMPIGCGGFKLLGTAGMANYNVKGKYLTGSIDKQRMGYRMGIGAMYDFTENLSFRLVGRYDFIGAKHLDNMMEMNAGIRYTF